MTFSGAVRVTDLNDFIAPSQSCVVSLNGQKKVKIDSESQEIQLQPRAVGSQRTAFSPPTGPVLPVGPRLPGTAQPKEGDAVKVTLHDCLACSGCVTTAETMLLEQQSVQDLQSALQRPDTCVVITVSPQSRAALAALHQLTPAETWSRLKSFLHSLGVRYVLDLDVARDLALLETAADFVSRFKQCQPQYSNGLHSQHATQQGHHASSQLSRLQQHIQQTTGSHTDTGMSHDTQGTDPLPLLASACPGWVCYAEKTQGEVVLPYLSTARSPQAIMGALVKGYLAQQLRIDPSQLYHCTIMPCYDKKLEASREEFTVPGTTIPEVDCCLTTVELHGLMQDKGIANLATGIAVQSVTTTQLEPLQTNGAAVNEDDMDVDDLNNSVSNGHFPTNSITQPIQLASDPTGLLGGLPTELYGLPGGSGGYMEFVYRVAAMELFGKQIPAGPLPMKQLRNADLQEIELKDDDGTTLLKCARVYGFRNIQTLMRQLKGGRCTYHYVEVMACPSGCLNGGGQIKPGPGQTPAQILEAAEAAYHHTQVVPRQPADNPAVPILYQTWVGGSPGSAQALKLLHTQYKGRGANDKNRGAQPGLVSDW